MIRWWVAEFLVYVSLVGYNYKKTKGSHKGGMAKEKEDV